MINDFNRKQSIKKATSPELAQNLEDYMSELSEKYFSASWKNKLEFILWRSLSKKPRDLCENILSYSEAFILKKFSDEAEGWFCWPETLGLSGPLFVTLEEWKEMYEKSRDCE